MEGELSASNSVTFDVGVEKLLYGIFQAIWSKLFWVKATEKILILRNDSLSVQFSFCSVVSDSLQPHGLQHARPPCPSPAPEVYLNSSPWSRWCHPTISSSVIPFPSCPQSFPASGSFPMSWLFPSGGKVLELQLQHQSFQWILRVDFVSRCLLLATDSWSP